MNQLAIMLGGHAEELVFHDLSTGAGTTLTTRPRLPGRWSANGDERKLGPLTFGKKGEEIFLGRDFGMQRDYSEAIAQTIDEEIKRLVEQQGETARKIVTENRDKLTRIAEALLEHESLDAAAVDRLLQEPVPVPPPANAEASAATWREVCSEVRSPRW